MLDIDNGWEKTPTIRCSMLGYNRPSVINRPGKLSDRKPSDEGIVEYQSDSRSDDGCKFVYTVNEYTELFGISKLKVWMSTDDHDDMVS